MRMTGLVAAMAAIVACASAHAQTRPVQTWTPPPQGELDPAKRVPATTPTAGAEPAAAQASQQVAPPLADGQAQLAQSHVAGSPVRRVEENQGGFFVGVQGGKGWIYEGVDQSARMINAGYRWQVGPVSLVGIEVASGSLDDAQEDGWLYDKVDYASVGANARFNFGRHSPVYGIVRAGYWAADLSVNDGDFRADVDGGYVGLGVGVDFNRHFNMSLTYTNYIYFTDYYWGNGYDVNRADTLMLGIEARF